MLISFSLNSQKNSVFVGIIHGNTREQWAPKELQFLQFLRLQFFFFFNSINLNRFIPHEQRRSRNSYVTPNKDQLFWFIFGVHACAGRIILTNEKFFGKNFRTLREIRTCFFDGNKRTDTQGSRSFIKFTIEVNSKFSVGIRQLF